MMTKPMELYIINNRFNDISNLERNVLLAYLKMRLNERGCLGLFRRRVGIRDGWLWSTTPNGIFRWRDLFRKYPGEIIHWWNFLFVRNISLIISLNLLKCITKSTYLTREVRVVIPKACSHLINGVRNLLNKS